MEEDHNSSETALNSVIIIAYDREKFIMDAVESVMNQNMKRSEFEVIVVKNFINADIDNTLERIGVKVINSEHPSIGKKLVEGFRKSQGNYVSFLEDDDLFDPAKLSKVREVFSTSDLDYYHNSVHFIDEKGTVIETSKGLDGTMKLLEKINEAYIPPGSDLNENALINKINFAYNLSSITVTRAFLQVNAKIIESTELGIDQLLLLLAEKSHCGILENSSKLTYFRIHDGNSTLGSKNKGGINNIENVMRIIEMSTRSNSIMFKLSRSTGLEREIAVKGRSLYLNNILLHTIRGGRKLPLVFDLLNYLRYAHKGKLRVRKDIVFYAILSALSSHLSRNVFCHRHSIVC